MPVTQPIMRSVGAVLLYKRADSTYPRTYPTIDMTAQDRVYLSLATNHAPVSGNISTNHSCNTGGNLYLLAFLSVSTVVDTNFAKTLVVNKGSFEMSEHASAR